jgi:hypothetical protein
MGSVQGDGVAQAQGPGRGEGAAQSFMNSQLAQPGG